MKRGSVVVSFAVLWAAYTLGCMGYFWLRGYQIGFMEMVSPFSYYKGDWPPAPADPSQVIPKASSA